VVLTVRPDAPLSHRANLVFPARTVANARFDGFERRRRRRKNRSISCKISRKNAPERATRFFFSDLHSPSTNQSSTCIAVPSQAVTLVLTCATIVAWTLGARTLSAALGAASLKAHLALVAETCARSVAPLPKTSRIAANAEPGFPDTRRARRRARRDANAFLVLDMFLTCVVALHTANVCGAVAFADPGVAAALALAWPAAIANWIGRLASETRWRVFDDVAVAVARKETTAMRRATRARRLGGLPAPKLPPPDAKRWRRIRYALALVAGQWREAAVCGSARAFRRVIAACCVIDWITIASVWSAMGVVSAVADGTLAHVSNVSAATLAPLATFLFLDAARIAAQLFHARLLVDARVSSDSFRVAGGKRASPNDGNGEIPNEPTRAASRAGWTFGPFGPFGRALPAGMVARLTRLTYALNVWNLALTVVAGVFLGPVVSGSNASALSFSSSGSFLVVVRFVVVARFARLVAETAYLASALLAVVDRPRIVAEGARGFPMPSLRLDLRDLGVDGDLAGAVAERLAAARALAARLGAGFAKDGSFAGPLRAFVDASFTRDVGAEAFASAPPAMSLAEFTEAIAPGLRGYLVGARAEAAAAKVFREIASSGGSPADASVPGDGSVGLADIQRWLAAQPSLRGPDGAPAAAASDAVSDVEKEIQWRRSVQRVLLRLARRAEYGRRQRGGGEGASAAAAAATAAASETRGADDEKASPAAAPAKPRGLRLLSLEGGGIKGLALIWQLRALERAAGRPIHELFDLIGGVSTGGIIALGLARGVPLRELEKMYHDIGRDVFGSQSAIRRLLKGNAADNTAIRDLLLEYLGDLPMLDAPGQLARCFVVSTQQTERLEVRLVRTYRHPNKGRDQNEGWRQWEAGMATSSAPTVFPPFVRENRGKNEGGGADTLETEPSSDAEGGRRDVGRGGRRGGGRVGGVGGVGGVERCGAQNSARTNADGVDEPSSKTRPTGSIRGPAGVHRRRVERVQQSLVVSPERGSRPRRTRPADRRVAQPRVRRGGGRRRRRKRKRRPRFGVLARASREFGVRRRASRGARRVVNPAVLAANNARPFEPPHGRRFIN
jgi:hypothetical protein